MRYLLALVGIGVLLALSPRYMAQQKDPLKDKKDPPAKEKQKEKDKEMPAKEMEEKEPDTTAEDTKLLKDVGVEVEGPALLEYFRKRTFKEADPKRLDRLIRELGDEDFVVRERAYEDLMLLGSSALVALKTAAEKNKNAE